MLLIHATDFQCLLHNKIIDSVSLIGFEDGGLGVFGGMSSDNNAAKYCVASSQKLEAHKAFRSVDAAVELISRMGVKTISVDIKDWQPELVFNEKKNWYQNRKNR